MATEIWVNIGSGNGLCARRHKAITWTNVDLSSIRSCGVHVRTISQEMTSAMNQLENYFSKFLSNLPGANELNRAGHHWFWLHTNPQTQPVVTHHQQGPLTHCGLVSSYGKSHIGSGDGLLPDGTSWPVSYKPWSHHFKLPSKVS